MLRENNPFKRASVIVIGLAVAQFILQAHLLTKGIEYIAGSLVIDDTYYYLQTAWNTKLLGFVTFDGLHATNGVQFLWFVVIFLLTFLTSSKISLLLTALVVSFLLNALCHLVILKIGNILSQPYLALIMASLWFLQSLPFRIYSMGMENSLHAFVFWCAIWQSLEFMLRVQKGEKPNFWGLTIVLILNAWTRLDSALLSAVLFVACVGLLAMSFRNNLRLFLQTHGKAVVGSVLLAGLGLLAQLFAFQLMGDSILPVSALIKTTAAGAKATATDNLVQIFTMGMPAILQGRFTNPILVLIGFSGMAVVILTRVISRSAQSELRTFWNLWACLLVGELIYHVYVALSGIEYRTYFIWYRSPSFIFWIITAALIVFFTLGQFRRVKTSPLTYQSSLIGLSVVISAVAIYMFLRSLNFTSDLYVTRYEAALWIAENSPPDTVFAAWNAGQLGYFSDRTFINLDGLINSVDYYERVLSGSVPLTEYLSENKVEYIVDYNTYSNLPEFPVVQSFPINDGSGRSIQIWQVSQLLSSMP